MSDRIYIAGCAALIGYSLGYALPTYVGLPHLFYDPIARRLLFTVDAGAVPMGYIGQLASGLVGATLTGAAAALLWGRRALSESAATLAGMWALTALLLVGSYFTWMNWP